MDFLKSWYVFVPLAIERLKKKPVLQKFSKRKNPISISTRDASNIKTHLHEESLFWKKSLHTYDSRKKAHKNIHRFMTVRLYFDAWQRKDKENDQGYLLKVVASL